MGSISVNEKKKLVANNYYIISVELTPLTNNTMTIAGVMSFSSGVFSKQSISERANHLQFRTFCVNVDDHSLSSFMNRDNL